MGVLDWFLSNAEAVFTGSASKRFRLASPTLLFTSLLASWTGFAVAGYPGLLLWTPYLSLLAVLAGRERLAAVLRTLTIPMLFITLMAAIFNPYKPLSVEWRYYLYSVVLRAFMYSSTGLIVVSGIGPSGAQRIVARLGSAVHDVTVLFYRQTPQLLRDLEIALAAQGTLGWKPHEALAGTLLESLRRNEEVKASLYLRGAAPGVRRTPLPPLEDGGEASAIIGVLLLVLGAGPLACLWLCGLF